MKGNVLRFLTIPGCIQPAGAGVLAAAVPVLPPPSPSDQGRGGGQGGQPRQHPPLCQPHQPLRQDQGNIMI